MDFSNIEDDINFIQTLNNNQINKEIDNNEINNDEINNDKINNDEINNNKNIKTKKNVIIDFE